MSDGTLPTCRACITVIANEPFEVSERFFGGHGTDDYVECETCGTVQMFTFPSDIPALYPPEDPLRVKLPGRVRRFMLRQRASAARGSSRNPIGRVLVRLYGVPYWADWMAETNSTTTSAILDVGSSDGALLLAMSASGYRDLTGIDPFIAGDRIPGPGMRLLRRRLGDHSGEYDLIMFNHSLEHMPDPTSELAGVHRLLAADGWVMVRLPVAGGYGWRTYGKHWFGLEPPRHLVLPSADGMERIAGRAGFRIVKTVYDGHSGFFAMGEAALNELPFDGPRRPSRQRAAKMYDKTDMERFRALAAAHNAAGDGDTAAFYLRRLEN